MLVGRSPTALYVGKLQALENDRASKAQQPLAQHRAYRSAAGVGGFFRSALFGRGSPVSTLAVPE
jgi:hypothetical protein